jgi:peptide/nickel transport system ATP-binding protein
MSGGQLQRICIARALALKPELIVCDEATSALDVSVQSTILDLLRDLGEKDGVHYLFICHDIALADNFTDQVMVMYQGRVVEVLKDMPLKTGARHPYTRLLLESVFPASPPESQGELEEKPVSAERSPRTKGPEELSKQGCAFFPRCPQRSESCRKAQPALRELHNGQLLACHQVP